MESTKTPLKNLPFTALIKLQKYFIKEISYLATPFGGPDGDRLDKLNRYVRDIDATIESKMDDYSLDVTE